MNKTTLKLLSITCFFSAEQILCMDLEKQDTLPVLRKNISINEKEAWLMEEKIEFSLVDEKAESHIRSPAAITISPFKKNETKHACDLPPAPNISPVKRSTRTRGLPELSYKIPLKSSPTENKWKVSKASPTYFNWRTPKGSPNDANWRSSDDSWHTPKASPTGNTWKHYNWSHQKSPSSIYYSTKKTSAKNTPKTKEYKKYIFIDSEKYNKFPAEESKISYADSFFGCLAKIFKTCSNSASEISDIAEKIKDLMYKNPTFVYFSDTKDKNEACRREISQKNAIIPTKYNCSDAYFFYYCKDSNLRIETKMDNFFASLIRNMKFFEPIVYVREKKSGDVTKVVSYINCPINYPSICIREINGRNSVQWFFAHEVCVMLEGEAIPQNTKIFPTFWNPETKESLTTLDRH